MGESFDMLMQSATKAYNNVHVFTHQFHAAMAYLAHQHYFSLSAPIYHPEENSEKAVKRGSEEEDTRYEQNNVLLVQ